MPHRVASDVSGLATTYNERMLPSRGTWLFLSGIAASLGVAFARVMGATEGLWVGIACSVVIAVLATASSPHVRVTSAGIDVAGAHLPATTMGQVRTLDRLQVRNALGPAGHRGAFVVTRGWMPSAVMIVVSDLDDPHPYWLVGTRRPDELQAALTALSQVSA